MVDFDGDFFGRELGSTMSFGSGGFEEGEMAIGKAQMGQRQTDLHIRVGVLLWLVLAIIAAVFFFLQLEGRSIWFFLALQFFPLLVGVCVAVVMGNINKRKWAAIEEQSRVDLAAQRELQMAEAKASGAFDRWTK